MHWGQLILAINLETRGTESQYWSDDVAYSKDYCLCQYTQIVFQFIKYSAPNDHFLVAFSVVVVGTFRFHEITDFIRQRTSLSHLIHLI